MTEPGSIAAPIDSRSGAPILRTQSLTVFFGGLAALKDVSM